MEHFEVVAEIPERWTSRPEEGIVEIPDSGGEGSHGFHDRCLVIEHGLNAGLAWVCHVNPAFTHLSNDSLHDLHLHRALVAASAIFMSGLTT